MFNQYRIIPTVNQAQKDEIIPLIEKMLKSEFTSQSEKSSREFSPVTFHGLKYADGCSIGSLHHLTGQESEKLVTFLNAQGLTCYKKVVNSYKVDSKEFIIFPGKYNKNDIIDALEKLFEPMNNPAIASNPNKMQNQ